MESTTDMLAIIPARKNSKGLIGKNLYPIQGQPLIYWTIKAAKESKYIKKIVVTSDSEEILNYSKSLGVYAHRRSDSLSLDETPMSPVVLDVLNRYPSEKAFILLQPTSPLRTTQSIDDAISIYLSDREADSVISVVPTDPCVAKYMALGERYLRGLVNNEYPFIRRQDLPSVYRPNGAIYIVDTVVFKRGKSFLTNSTLPFIMNEKESVDIDTIEDVCKVKGEIGCV